MVSETRCPDHLPALIRCVHVELASPASKSAAQHHPTSHIFKPQIGELPKRPAVIPLFDSFPSSEKTLGKHPMNALYAVH
jgi:hypothetical protein